MRFYSRCEALDYWKAAYAISGGNKSNEELFEHWVEDQMISWLDDEDRLFIESF